MKRPYGADFGDMLVEEVDGDEELRGERSVRCQHFKKRRAFQSRMAHLEGP